MLALFLLMLTPYAWGAPLTLRQIVEYAWQHSPQLTAARGDLGISELESENARAQFFPKLDLSANHGLGDTIPKSSDTPWRSDAALTLSQVLYDGGRNYLRYDTAKAKRALAQLQYLQKRDQLTLDVVLKVQKIALLRSLLKLNEQQVAVVRRQAQMIDHKYRQGLTPAGEYLRVQSTLQQAELDVGASRGNVDFEILDMRQLMGATEDLDVSMATAGNENPKAPMVPVGPPRPEKNILKDVIEMQRQIGALGVDAVRKQTGPQVALNSGVGYGSQDYIGPHRSWDAQDKINWNITLGLKWTLWDFGTERRQIEIADRQRQMNDDANLEQLRKRTVEEAQLMASLSLQRDSFDLQQKRLQTERNVMTQMERDYREGKTDMYAFMDALNKKLFAETQYIQSYYALENSLTTYRFYEGTLDGTLDR